MIGRIKILLYNSTILVRNCTMDVLEIQTDSRMWAVVANSAKNDALTALFFRGKRKEIELYRNLWVSEIPVCDAVVGGMCSYGLVPKGFDVCNISVREGYRTTSHTLLLNYTTGFIIDPTAAQFFKPDFLKPGAAVYRMLDKNPGRVIIKSDLGLGILMSSIDQVRGIKYLV